MQHTANVKGIIGAGAAAVLLTACSGTGLSGTYRADFSTSNVADVALAGELQQLALEFRGDSAVLEMRALGSTNRVEVDATYRDGTVVLEQDGAWVLAIRDEDTLECVQCPAGVPGIWKKVAR